MATIVEALRYALTKLQANDLAEVERVAREILGHEPDNVDALHMLGLACRRTERNDEAIVAFRRAIEQRPDRAIYYFELGIALKHAGDPEGSLAIYRQAVEVQPNLQEAYVNGGAALDDLGRQEEAIEWYNKALALKPNCPSSLLNLGNAYQALGQNTRAIEHYDRAVAVDPENANAHWNRSMALLRCGRFRQGWQEYEWRMAAGETKLDDYPQPRWDGSSLAGKTLLVHAEQGVGDEILFASCYPELVEQAGHCIFICETRLASLFARSFPQATVRGYRRRHERTPCEVDRPVDYQIAAGSLPGLLRTEADSFPDRSHYLVCDPKRLALWRERFSALGPGLKVGISWRAGGKPSEQVRRTTGLAQWRGILSLPGVQFVNLQYGEASEDIAEAESRFGIRIHDWPDADALTDLEGLAAQISALDLVIAVGNTTVHLAGSLGVESWSLLPANPSWRWMSDVDRVPWYRNVRLIRQRRGESWKPVFDQVRRQLCRRLGRDDLAVESSLDDAANCVAIEGTDQGQALVRIPAQVTGMNFVAQLTERMQTAVKHHQAGELPAAEAIYRDILRNTPQHIDALHLLGVVCQQTNRLEQGLRYLKQAIAICDTEHNFHFHLGLALRDSGRLDESLACYRRALELKPGFAEALLNLGAGLQERGQFDEAIDCYQQALEARPDTAGIHLNLGTSLRGSGRRTEAQRHLRKALRLQPVFPEAQVQLGQILHELKQIDDAIACYQQALAARPDYAAAYRCLGKAYQDQQRFDEAIVCYQQALEIKPRAFDGLANLGLAFQHQQQYALAADAFRRALEIEPHNQLSLINLAQSLRHLGQLDEALACCDRVLLHAPAHAATRRQRAEILLQRGDLAAGWDEYAPDSASLHEVAHDRQSLAGRTVLVRAEATIEDAILFASCLPDLLHHAKRVVVECSPRLAPLWKRSFPTAIIQPGHSFLECETHLGPADLPRIFRRSAGDFPRQHSYLAAEQTRTDVWRNRYAVLGHGLKVGILAMAERGAYRAASIPAWDQWRGVLGVPEVQFICLQPEASAAQLEMARAHWGATIHSIPLVTDLDEQAAQLAALDLVISIDDPAVHLAAALGTPVWTLLNHAWGWRWMLGREDSPWHPSMRLFRPRRVNAWAEMMDRVRHALCDYVATLPGGRRDPPHRLGAPRSLSVSHRGANAWP